MGLGTIHIMKRPIWHGEGEGFMVDSPEFDLNKPLLVGKKLLHGNSPVPGKMSPSALCSPWTWTGPSSSPSRALWVPGCAGCYWRAPGGVPENLLAPVRLMIPTTLGRQEPAFLLAPAATREVLWGWSMVVDLAAQGQGLMAQKQDICCWVKSHCGGRGLVSSRGATQKG